MPQATKVNSRSYADEMYSRASMVSQSSIDEANRTVRATLATDKPVPVYDWRSRSVIDEVLTTRGGKFPSQMPLFDDHWMSSSRQLGSIRSIVQSDGQHDGVLHFARDAGSLRDEQWEMVRQKHVTDVSIGYTYGDSDYVDIAPGQRSTIDGVEYVAGKRTKRVVTNWRALEASTTPIGADDQAKIRGKASYTRTGDGDPVDSPVVDDPNLPLSPVRAGMAKVKNTPADGKTNASDTPADQADGQRSDGTAVEQSSTPAPAATDNATPATDQRTAAPAGHASVPGTSATEIADRTRKDERQRLHLIESYRGFDEITDEMITRSIDDNWDEQKVRSEFDHQIVRSVAERAPVGPNHRAMGAVQTDDVRSLQMALLMRFGIQPDSKLLRCENAQHMLRGDSHGDWLVRSSMELSATGKFGESEKAIDMAYRQQAMSIKDIIKRGLELEGVRTSSIYDESELLQRAMSSASLGAIFTLAFNARVLMGFETTPDTTRSWTREEVLPNFQPAERIQEGLYTKLQLRTRGSTPEHATVDATSEYLRAFMYADKFIMDEMDVKDDTMGTLGRTPEALGKAAAALRPDLVYSVLLANAALSDGTALFHADHGNLNAATALDDAGLSKASGAMATQTMIVGEDEHNLAIDADILIVPRLKRDDAMKLVRSREVLRTNDGNFNVHENAYTIAAEPRLDTGVVDPLTKTKHAGQAANWYTATRGGQHGISVATVRGYGNRPRVQRLPAGQLDGYGFGWKADHSIGVGATGYRGIHKNQP